MAHTLYGPFDELFELHSTLDGIGDATEAIPDDPILLQHYLRGFLDSPLNRDALLRALEDDPFTTSRALTDGELCELLSTRLAMGSLRLVRPAGGIVITPSGGTGPATAPQPAEPPPEPAPPAREEPKTRDWRLECAHHASEASRAVFHRGTTIQVVPSKGQIKDKVKLWWKDEYLGSLPSSLPVRSPGRPEAQATMESGGGTTGTFAFDAEYRGDIDIRNFLLPAFWRSFNEKTPYTIGPGPSSVNVEVFNPRQFKFELSLPPMAGFKSGVKYEAESTNPTKLAKPTELTKKFETEDTYWSPKSSLKVQSYKTATHPDADFKPSGSELKLDAIKLWRDGTAIDLDVLKLVGKILEFRKSLEEIVKAIKKFKDYAPSVGWYIDFGLNLFQGGLAVEWYWKEHTDHRVFQYIDVNVSLKIFTITFEFGLGVGAFSFKLQIFAQITGEMSLEAGMKRDSPDGAPGFTFPALKGKLAGALGARVEAGAFFKFEAKGETAVEAELVFGINRRSSPVTFDLRARWTGIECTATGSVGIWGIGGTRTWKSTLVPPSAWAGIEWPKEEEFKPPYLSRDRIANVVEGVITSGWNVRVIQPSGNVLGIGDVHWTPERIAGEIANRIDADSKVDRDPDTIDGLAHSVRGDLDRLGSRFGRDYVEESAFLQYLDGQFKQRLRAAYSATSMLIAANK